MPLVQFEPPEIPMLPLPRFYVLSLACLAASCSIALSAPPARAEPVNHGEMAAQPASVGQTLLDKLQGLVGTWDAQLSNGVMTDIFTPFAFGTAVLGEEWLNGKQITATVFYVVNGELRADHYCDYLNQPRYTAVPSVDPAVIDFQFREATNLDTHPLHFHGTTWRIVDATHLIQDWFVMGGKKPVSVVHMEFARRAEGSPPPQPIPAKG
jgi:hypothetical protein